MIEFFLGTIMGLIMGVILTCIAMAGVADKIREESRNVSNRKG